MQIGRTYEETREIYEESLRQRANRRKQTAQMLITELGKEDMVVLGWNCFFTAANETIDRGIRIATLATAVSEYENQNYHDIAEAIWDYRKEVMAGRA